MIRVRDALDWAGARGLPPAWWAPLGPRPQPGLWMPERHDLGAPLRALCWWTPSGPDPNAWQLRLDPAAETGELERSAGSGGSPDWHRYAHGQEQQHDAWSDQRSPTRLPFRDWVRGAVDRVLDAVRCGACLRPLSRAPPAQIGVDGRQHLCADCVEGLRARPPTAGFEIGPADPRCLLCLAPIQPGAPVHGGRGGLVCTACVAAFPPPPGWRGLWRRLRR